MSSWRDTFLNLSLDARKVYADKCRQGSGKKTRLSKFTFEQYVKESKQDVIDFAKRHKVWTKADMDQAIRKNKSLNPPSGSTVVYLFGTWDRFLKELHSEPGYATLFSGKTDEELAWYCSKLPIRNKYDYMKLRKTDAGNCLPPFCAIERRFGSFAMFLAVVMSYKADFQFQRYFTESAKEGRLLTVEECDEKQIEIRYLVSVLSYDLFVMFLEEKLEMLSGKSFFKKDVLNILKKGLPALRKLETTAFGKQSDEEIAKELKAAKRKKKL